MTGTADVDSQLGDFEKVAKQLPWSLNQVEGKVRQAFDGARIAADRADRLGCVCCVELRRHWRLDDGREERDVIRRRVLGPREVELYLEAAGFELLDVVDRAQGQDNGRLTGPSVYIAARYLA